VTDTVVVFGVTSYVGDSLIQPLLDSGKRVVGITRRPGLARILLPPESEQFAVVGPDKVESAIGHDPISIINLAYIRDAPPHRLYRQNRGLVKSIGRVAADRCRRLVHVSTAAVFGYGISEPPHPGPVRWRPADLYTESKIDAERLIRKLSGEIGGDLAIVRLGNVIGPGSPNFVSRLGQRILEVEPVAYDGEAGFSNSTHVENAASYLAFLLAEPADALSDFGTYHHLAEFSSHRWPELLGVISDVVGHRWTTASRPRRPPGKPPLPKRAFKAAYRTSVGARLRPAAAVLPEGGFVDRAIGRLRSPAPPQLNRSGEFSWDANLLELLSAENEFRSHTLDGWKPQLDFDSACAGIADWLRRSDYSLKPDASP
jgi:nucleoside-diphosphate-sugar epimerase